jgi:hypothetical protein
MRRGQVSLSKPVLQQLVTLIQNSLVRFTSDIAFHASHDSSFLTTHIAPALNLFRSYATNPAC